MTICDYCGGDNAVNLTDMGDAVCDPCLWGPMVERETTSVEKYNYYDVVTESGWVIWSHHSYGAALLWAKDYESHHDVIVEVKGWK